MAEMTVLKLIGNVANMWFEKTHDDWWLNLALIVERRYKPIEIRKRNCAKNRF